MTVEPTIRRVKQYGYFALYYLRSLIGDKRPLLGGVKLTHECTLSCRHCPFWRRKAESLSFSQAILSLRALHDLGVRIVILEGGEPLLWRDGQHTISDIISKAKRLFFSVCVTTNGTLPISIDADTVWVSIDGLQETHDRIRGKSFERILANIASSTHPKIYAHITINALNWKEIPELVTLLSNKVKGITIQFHYPYEELDDELFLPFAERRRVLDDLIRMKRDGLPVADSFACLEALKDNRWKCQPWMIASVDPDGRLTRGCYVKGRGEVACENCGFAAHTELSLAYRGVIESILVGNRTFF